jgi:hypothetical protein
LVCRPIHRLHGLHGPDRTRWLGGGDRQVASGRAGGFIRCRRLSRLASGARQILGCALATAAVAPASPATSALSLDIVRTKGGAIGSVRALCVARCVARCGGRTVVPCTSLLGGRAGLGVAGLALSGFVLVTATATAPPAAPSLAVAFTVGFTVSIRAVVLQNLASGLHCLGLAVSRFGLPAGRPLGAAVAAFGARVAAAFGARLTRLAWLTGVAGFALFPAFTRLAAFARLAVVATFPSLTCLTRGAAFALTPLTSLTSLGAFSAFPPLRALATARTATAAAAPFTAFASLAAFTARTGLCTRCARGACRGA